ncbi:dephospho-CoA kinase [Corynebacterium halotolerans]|uniref:dephospho-CoA kinase n=1 Tax=Corynebacterium halotolerans TaxID=225326 RepID=UPI003CF5949B
MLRIGLTGGIGSGKSTVAALLATHAATAGDLNLEVVDADQIARDIVEPGRPALQELAEAFGPDILDDAGALRRKELAARAFTDPERTSVLNSITHPRIREETLRRFEQAEESGIDAVVYDMPLLVDNGYHRNMDLVVVVDVDAEERVRRLTTHRGITEPDARARINAQIPDAERLAAADVIVDNNGTPAALEPQVERLTAEIQRRING